MGFSKSELECIAKLSPLASTLKSLMIDLAVDSVLLTSKEMENKELSLMCDKGEESRTGVSFVKLVAFYDTHQKRVVVRYFGIEQAGNSSKDAAMAINYALKLFGYSHGVKFCFTSTMTNAGGGGVGSSLLEHLILVDQAITTRIIYGSHEIFTH